MDDLGQRLQSVVPASTNYSCGTRGAPCRKDPSSLECNSSHALGSWRFSSPSPCFNHTLYRTGLDKHLRKDGPPLSRMERPPNFPCSTSVSKVVSSSKTTATAAAKDTNNGPAKPKVFAISRRKTNFVEHTSGMSPSSSRRQVCTKESRQSNETCFQAQVGSAKESNQSGSVLKPQCQGKIKETAIRHRHMLHASEGQDKDEKLTTGLTHLQVPQYSPHRQHQDSNRTHRRQRLSPNRTAAPLCRSLPSGITNRASALVQRPHQPGGLVAAPTDVKPTEAMLRLYSEACRTHGNWTIDASRRRRFQRQATHRLLIGHYKLMADRMRMLKSKRKLFFGSAAATIIPRSAPSSSNAERATAMVSGFKYGDNNISGNDDAAAALACNRNQGCLDPRSLIPPHPRKDTHHQFEALPTSKNHFTSVLAECSERRRWWSPAAAANPIANPPVDIAARLRWKQKQNNYASSSPHSVIWKRVGRKDNASMWPSPSYNQPMTSFTRADITADKWPKPDGQKINRALKMFQPN